MPNKLIHIRPIFSPSQAPKPVLSQIRTKNFMSKTIIYRWSTPKSEQKYTSYASAEPKIGPNSQTDSLIVSRSSISK